MFPVSVNYISMWNLVSIPNPMQFLERINPFVFLVFLVNQHQLCEELLL